MRLSTISLLLSFISLILLIGTVPVLSKVGGTSNVEELIVNELIVEDDLDSSPRQAPRVLHPCPGDTKHQCPPGSCAAINAKCIDSGDCCGADKGLSTCKRLSIIRRQKYCLKK